MFHLLTCGWVYWILYIWSKSPPRMQGDIETFGLLLVKWVYAFRNGRFGDCTEFLTIEESSYFMHLTKSNNFHSISCMLWTLFMQLISQYIIVVKYWAEISVPGLTTYGQDQEYIHCLFTCWVHRKTHYTVLTTANINHFWGRCVWRRANCMQNGRMI